MPTTTIAGVSPTGFTVLYGLELFGAFLGFGSADPRVIIANIVRLVLGFVGIIFVLLIILAGFQYMLSRGDEEKTKKARQTLVNAFVGFILILGAYSIVRFLINALLQGTTQL